MVVGEGIRTERDIASTVFLHRLFCRHIYNLGNAAQELLLLAEHGQHAGCSAYFQNSLRPKRGGPYVRPFPVALRGGGQPI